MQTAAAASAMQTAVRGRERGREGTDRCAGPFNCRGPTRDRLKMQDWKMRKKCIAGI